MKRCFLAFELNYSLIENLNKIILRYKNHKNIKWIKEKNLHATIFFLGNVSIENIYIIDKIIEKETQKLSSFFINNAKIELFPLDKPKLIWLKAEFIDNKCENFIRKIRGKLYDYAEKKDNKKFKMHITLGRIKGQINLKTLEAIFFEPVYAMPSLINKISLYESVLKKTGPQYFALKSYNL